MSALKKARARGHELMNFERSVYDLALGGRTRLLGPVTFKRTAEAITVSDIVVNFQIGTAGLEPSLLDAMFMGRVVVGSDVSPWADWIRGGRHGFAVKMTHQNDLRTIFLELAQRPELRQQIGTLGKARAAELLEPEQIATKLDRAFRGIVQRKRHPHRPAA